MKKIKVLILLLLIFLSGCQKKEEEIIPAPEETVLEVRELSLEHEEEFGGVYLKMPIEEFNALGFDYGDSVDVLFSNGYKLEDIPYYNGYYVDAGKPLLIAYPGYEYIKAAVNYGEDIWQSGGLKAGKGPSLYTDAKLKEHDTADVLLREKGKYLDIQKASDISYSDDITKYPDVISFTNFRNIEMGRIAKGKVYRSASPCDDQHKRAPYVDELIKENGVNFILDLADNEVKIERYIHAEGFSSPYFLSLYESDRVCPLGLNMNYLSEEFGDLVAQGFKVLAENEGPYLIHCTEGKDRTGFVCMLLEMLAGCAYEDIKNDYMITYANYYQIDEESQPDKYQTILEKNLHGMLKKVIGDDTADFRNADLSVYARAYLSKHGMSEEEMDSLLNKIG